MEKKVNDVPAELNVPSQDSQKQDQAKSLKNGCVGTIEVECEFGQDTELQSVKVKTDGDAPSRLYLGLHTNLHLGEEKGEKQYGKNTYGIPKPN